MRKYWAVYKLSLQNALTYRSSILVFRLSTLLTLIIMAALWLSAKGNGLIGGFTKAELLTYYLGAMVITPLVTWYATATIREDIADGPLAAFYLPKPLNYYWYQFFDQFGWHTFSPLFGFLILAFALAFFGSYFTWTISGSALVVLIISLSLAALLTYTMSFCLAMMAFWFLETSSLSSLFWMGTFLFGGEAIPLSFFPVPLLLLARILPFRYIFSFPLEILSNKLNLLDLVVGFSAQVLWIVIFKILADFLWRKGLKVYSAYGG